MSSAYRWAATGAAMSWHDGLWAAPADHQLRGRGAGTQPAFAQLAGHSILPRLPHTQPCSSFNPSQASRLRH